MGEDCEALINKQINMEFYASYVYLSMSSYFSRDDQALPGFAAHFAKESEEEREHGMKLMAYQSKRGGRCVFQDIAKPVSMEWGTCLEAMEAALELEKMVNQSLLELTKAADDKGDSHLSDFLDEFLEDQVASDFSSLTRRWLPELGTQESLAFINWFFFLQNIFGINIFGEKKKKKKKKKK